MKRGYVSVCCVAVLLAMLAGCTGAARNPLQPTMDGKLNQCGDVYVYAPAVYVINIVSGQMVALDPMMNEFPLFCEPDAARAAIKAQVAAGNLPSDIEWKVYRVYGDWADLATPRADGAYLLNKPAQIIDWVD